MVMVSVDDQEGNSANAIADGAGSFRIEDAPAGRVAVSAEAMSSSGTRTTGSRELTLAAGSETSTVLEFKDDLVITGTVTRMGAQVGNVSVSFLSGGATATTTTDRAGHYEIGVAGGTYDVSLSGENISFQTTYEAAASGVFDIDVTVGGVRGRTLDAATQAPVADASVSLWLLGKGENVPASTLTTTAQGSFDAPSLREGRYRLVTSKKGYGQEVREVEVTRGSTAEVVFELQPAGGVTVTVADARDGRPLAAIVVVRDADRRIVANRHAGADADGAVTIPLSDGAYLLSTSASGYGTATLPIASPARGLRVGLTPGGTLVIESSQPLPGRIRLMQPDGEEYVRCWCNGIAEIKLEGRRTTVENVAAGPYTMELVDAPGRTFSQAIVIQEGQTTTVAID
jgi:5-hydroxyisourate hydrolase-like protein (transthyretin family)